FFRYLTPDWQHPAGSSLSGLSGLRYHQTKPPWERMSASESTATSRPDTQPDAGAEETFVEAKVRKLQSLVEVGKALTAVLDLESLLKLVVDEAQKMVDAD